MVRAPVLFVTALHADITGSSGKMVSIIVRTPSRPCSDEIECAALGGGDRRGRSTKEKSSSDVCLNFRRSSRVLALTPPVSPSMMGDTTEGASGRGCRIRASYRQRQTWGDPGTQSHGTSREVSRVAEVESGDGAFLFGASQRRLRARSNAPGTRRGGPPTEELVHLPP